MPIFGQPCSFSRLSVIKFFTRDKLTADVDRRLRAYDDEVRSLIGNGYRWPIRMRDWELWETMDAFERHAGSRDLVLDTGSFNTFLPLWMGRRAGRVVASDLLWRRRRRNLLRRIGLLPRKPTEAPYSEWRRALARGGSNVELRSVDLTGIPFGDRSFDCITSVSVIEHIPEPEAALKEMFRSLKPGGVLLLTTDCSPVSIPFRNGTGRFTRDELASLVKPYLDVGGCPEPSFERANWCYGRNEPIVTAFVRITKPCSV